MARILASGCACAAATLALAAWAPATVVTFEAWTEMSGAYQPAGTAPWVTAKFDDGGGTGSVALTLTTSGLVGSEYVSNWAFNVVDPPPTNLAITDTTSDTVGTIGIALVPNEVQGDGAGLFDIGLSFPVAPLADRFGAGETVVLTVTGTGLTASSFQAVSSNGYDMVAHVQSIGEGGLGSGWVTTPEPTTALLLLTPLLMLQRRKRQHR